MLTAAYFCSKWTAALLLLWTCWLLPSVRRELAGLPRWSSRGLAAVLVVHLALCWWVIPPGPWQPNNHGTRVVLDLRDGVWPPDLASTHGWGWVVLLRAIWPEALRGTWTLFDVMPLLSALGIAGLFALTWAWLAHPGLALAAASLLALSPLQLRMARTETMSVPLTLLLVWMLLGFALHRRTGRAAFWGIGVLAMALAVQTRLEFALFAPWIGLSTYALLDRPHRRALLLRPAVVAWLAVAVASVAPWLGWLRSGQPGRLSPWSSGVTVWLQQTFADGFGVAHPLLDPTLAPWPFLALFVLGCWHLYHATPSPDASEAWQPRPKLVLWWALACWVPLHVVHVLYRDSLSTELRTGASSQLFAVLLAAYGAVEVWQRRWLATRTRLGIVAGAAVLGGIPCTQWLLATYQTQREFHFAAQHASQLPQEVGVVTLLAEDEGTEREVVPDRSYVTALLRVPGSPTARKVTGVRAWLAHAEPTPKTLYYQSAACFRVPVDPRAPQSRRAADNPNYIHPLCAEMARRFAFRPLAQTVLYGPSLDLPEYGIQGANPRIGLYELAVREPAPAEESR